MKKVILTIALAVTAAVAYGQGTIQFANSTLTRVRMEDPVGTFVQVPTTANLINYGVFWSTTQDGTYTLALPVVGNSTTSAGIIPGGNNYALTGTEASTAYWLYVAGWTASFGNDWQSAMTQGTWWGTTDKRQVMLGPAAGPGTVIWQSASGTNPNRFLPLVLHPVPEPSTLAIVGLGMASLLIFRRKS